MADVFTNVEEAKGYIEYFNKYVAFPAPITFVDTNQGKRILLNSMNDEDTLFVANGLREMELQVAIQYRGAKQ